MRRLIAGFRAYWAWWLVPFLFTASVLIILLARRPQRDTVRMMYDLTRRP